MNLYLISQSENNDYDTYDAAVVAAESEDQARNIQPGGVDPWEQCGTWCSAPDKVNVVYLGIAKDGQPQGIVLASFNAG